ncbi:hypothetical protein ACUY3H_02500 [Corynebacterium ureicelerivorans]
MNLKTIGLVATGANQARKYLRAQSDKRERDIYQSLLDNLKDGDLDNLHEKLSTSELEELYGSARAHAGDITRDAHDRLDRRHAAFAEAAPSRKERQELLRAHAKDAKKKKKGGFGKVVKTTLGTAALAGGAWAAWEFFLKDKLTGDNTANTTHPAPARTETDRRGNSTIVYSTRTEDDRLHPNEADTDGLTTLDTLADNQRETTHARNDLEAEAEAQNNADGGAEFGRHELRDDR